MNRLPLRLPDGYVTNVYVHEPAASARRSAVLYVHGIQSHPGWFVGSAQHLASAGYDVFQPTRRGSGDNASARGDALSAEQLLDDVDAAARFAMERAGCDRLHLLGVSWGGKLLAAFVAARRPAWAASLTLIAPGIMPRVDMLLHRKLAVAAALLLSPGRTFEIPLNNVNLFSDNPVMRDYLRRDAHRLLRATARFLLASRRLDRMLAKARAGCLSLPATLILARRDAVIDNAATLREVERLTAGKANVRTLDGAHTLEFEADPGSLYDAMTTALAMIE